MLTRRLFFSAQLFVLPVAHREDDPTASRPSKGPDPRDHRQGGRRASGGLPQAPHPFNINASATSTTATDR
ncbi:hypothetical protein DPMN_137708 [Dreissena polymorpha]|uniref:Secreted protein n=1 Tax=Dreissena polymorpha TaxID=45954 RepID=A0A9D4JEY0_DREPO|nr:hypothetical protein DPMN_137708 [Dreissena polymorpha]